ncbi:hypothetical protein QT381_15175 [Galbitalea sp. SE-J8]|uniref:hypothetical protein n=1 Tax=Galbitalea sp. SE-J8 TaxID=3054952 RepID=UPI00259CE4DB|nr:hypothetical protein [Galbitalea sp. SE-J8]MDM4764343.1 hypothetical protein [Galbitalea sp. SE-J8]
MRFVVAIVSIVVATVLIGIGVAQQTILKLPDRVTASVHLDSTAPVTIIDASVLGTFPNTQRVTITGAADAPVFASIGRTSDVLAWIGDASYTSLSYNLETRELDGKLHTGTEATVPNPAGSDLWTSEYSSTGTIHPDVLLSNANSPKTMLIASDGTAPAPADVSISWPVENDTPWAGPLLIAGGALLVVGLALLLWSIIRLRIVRGPRRRSPRMPKLPKRPRYKPSKRAKPLPSSRRGRRSTRFGFVVPVAVASAVVLAGCTFEPAPVPVETPTATATTDAAPTPPPVVSERQARVILSRIRSVADKADADLDGDLAATRFTGPALELRRANYTIRKDDKKEPAVAAIPDGAPQILLPQKSESWPRTVFVVAPYSDATKSPLAMMLVQQDARSNYTVQYAMSLEPGAVIPQVPAAEVGADQVAPDLKTFTVLPSQLAAAYGDILINDSDSPWFASFDETSDSLRDSVGKAAKEKRRKALPDTAKLTFSNAPGTGPVIVLATVQLGAIVAVDLDETETVKPVETGATVTAPNNVRALSGKSTSSTGLRAEYSDQLLFYVPPITQTGGLVKLLGYASGMVSASEVKK